MTELVGGKSASSDNTVLVLRLLGVLALLYLFVLAITLLGASFKLAGKGFAEQIFGAASNPIVSLCIGVLATTIIQSSSTTTSLIVALVASGSLDVQNAVPMVMGANIGTSVTNTLVSLAHISRGDEFKRAFAGSTVHDFFNICAVTVLLPLEVFFGVISRSAYFVEQLFEGFGGLKFSSPIKAVTKPVAKEIIHFLDDSAWLTAIIAAVLTFVALRYIVLLLKKLVLVRVEKFFQRFIFRTPALGFFVGIVLTVLVQSSSITTSLVVPLLGAGVLNIHQVFPYMLGANIGTTVTAFLASFVTGSAAAVSVAFAHLIFNIYGSSIFWPLKRIPISMSLKLSALTQRSRIIPVAYILVAFFLLPGTILFFME